MAGKFSKSILKVGTYESPDGTVDVTPERLKNWSTQFERMSTNRQVIPMHWDHGSDNENLQPVSEESFTRSARNSVGKLESFKLSADGQSAEIVVNTLTKDATEKTAANAVYVSPVIMPTWQDGFGNVYKDCITHMDLVNHPVDHSQGDFVPVDSQIILCGIRMGLGKPAFQKVTRMANEDKDPPFEKDDATPNDTAAPNESAADAATDDTTTDPAYDVDKHAGSDTEVTDVLILLQEFGLTLPEDTDKGNLFERLRVALTATTKAKQEEEEPEEEDPMKNSIVSDPMMATMSLKANQAIAYGERTHQREITNRLQALLENGQCSPAEFNTKKPLIGTVKLSLDAKGNPLSSELEAWIESREGIPKGSCWDKETKLTRMGLREVEAPMSWDFKGSSISKSDEDAAVLALTRR